MDECVKGLIGLLGNSRFCDSSTIIPTILLLMVDGIVFDVLKYILWVNAIIAGSDIINSVLIAIKPTNAKFCRGYYSTEV